MERIRVERYRDGIEVMLKLPDMPSEADFYDNGKRLYHCNAKYLVKDDFVFLMSYSTIVAVYDRKKKILYDLLRYVYGYTSTSSQHINKFIRFITENHY